MKPRHFGCPHNITFGLGYLCHCPRHPWPTPTRTCGCSAHHRCMRSAALPRGDCVWCALPASQRTGCALEPQSSRRGHLLAHATALACLVQQQWPSSRRVMSWGQRPHTRKITCDRQRQSPCGCLDRAPLGRAAETLDSRRMWAECGTPSATRSVSQERGILVPCTMALCLALHVIL